MIINIFSVYYRISNINYIMKKKILRTRKNNYFLTSPVKETIKHISEEDIRKRAFEIFQENDYPSSSALDNWYYAERELTGYYK